MYTARRDGFLLRDIDLPTRGKEPGDKFSMWVTNLAWWQNNKLGENLGRRGCLLT